MENLTEVTVANLKRRIASHADNAEHAFGRLIKEGKISQDFVTPIGTNNDQRSQIMDFVADEQGVFMQMKNERFNIHQNAVYQLGEKLNVPARYLQQLSGGNKWERDLCAQILNEHSGYSKRDRVLVRAVGDQVRGVLSDKYRRLNSSTLIESFVKIGYKSGAVLADGLMTDTKIYIEMLMPQPITFETPKNGLATMAYGARLSNSDYGSGALELRAFTMQGVCLNGMVRESVMRTVHLGSRLPDNLSISERTYRLDTQTQESAIRDLTAGLFDSKMIQREMELIQNASAIDVDIELEVKKLPKLGMLKEEAEGVERILMNGRAEDGVSGEPTLWKFVNGITAYARDREGAREREIQEIAGKLMKRAETLK
jgi:hypothetical protein